MYTVLINSSANINSRQLIGSSRDADGYGVVALIFALKGPSAGDEGIGLRLLDSRLTHFSLEHPAPALIPNALTLVLDGGKLQADFN